ncbi:MAG: DUF2911 domain-containing protein [Gemmatimonadota bacterium]|nr:DUF2911 domain-containing protein [Gemmatimonadota bacterium]
MRPAVLTLLLATSVPIGLWAQAIPFSQHATVSQRVGITDLLITWNRPVARGRILFGDEGLVKWGQTWNPGADSATRIAISRDVEIEGRPVPRGEYTLWLVPAMQGPWTLILNRQSHIYHTPYPGAEDDLFRVSVEPARGDHMEVLAWYFPVVARDTAVLRMHWGETVVPVRIRTFLDPP